MNNNKKEKEQTIEVEKGFVGPLFLEKLSHGKQMRAEKNHQPGLILVSKQFGFLEAFFLNSMQAISNGKKIKDVEYCP